MKKKALLSSILTIALCLSLIAGSTFALFTDSTDFNIAITSGDIEIKATAAINAVYSAKGADAADDKYLVDEFGHTYTHELQANDTFVNGGTATVTDGNLEIVNITPGDRVDVDIVVDNTSNVAFVYRYKVEAVDTFLATGMVFTVDGESYEAVKTWTSAWYPVVVAGDTVTTKTFSLELPVFANNDYQSEVAEGKIQKAEYKITVEAVQGNAVTDDESAFTFFPTQSALQTAVDNGAVIDLEETTFVSPEGFVLGDQATTFVNGTVTSDYTGGVAILSNNAFTDAAGVHNADVTLGEGAVVEVSANSAYGYCAFFFEGDSHKITLDADAKLVANSTEGACIRVSLTSVDLYLESLSSLEFNNGSNCLQVVGNGHLTIHVANDTVKAELENLLNSSTFCVVDSNSTVTVVVG